MTAARILNQAQAEAVYSAICALNAVSEHSGQISIGDALVIWGADGAVTVVSINSTDREAYPLQYIFAAAYGLDGKETRTAVYTPGIGWQVQDRHGRRGNFETEAEALAN